MRLALFLLFLIVLAVPAQAQLTNAQKQAFADMELRGLLDLGMESHLISRIIHWYRLGNQAAAITMFKVVYTQTTGLAATTVAERHALRHWLERYELTTAEKVAVSQ